MRIETPREQSEYLIDGRVRRWAGPMRTVESPVCLDTPNGPVRKVLGRSPLLDPETALEALEAARRAWNHGRGPWPALPWKERLRRVAGLSECLKENRAEIVRLLMWEVAKPLAQAEDEFDRTIDYIDDTIQAAGELAGSWSGPARRDGLTASIRRAPIGTALLMGPYNYPLNETMALLLPALIMGNTAVVKPPKMGLLLLHPLLAACRDLFPPGTVNFVYGRGSTLVGPLMRTGRIDVLGFIGSMPVAQIVKAGHPRPHRLHAVLGLQAKNAAIVLDDADLDLTVRECVRGSLGFNGQRCTALKILFVHRRIADAFMARFVPAVQALRCGPPWMPGVDITPLPLPGKPEYLDGLVREAVSKGAELANPGGGRIIQTSFSPAVLYPVGPG
ncbi:MAG: aldehyde dehydrogenase family protein, partial [Proteobacteria bacterium]|nr:aldehyde dehydrogenase family protein [Pseudomonadota bacterium]